MTDIELAKKCLLENNLNFVLTNNKRVLKESKDRGIKPIFHTFKVDKNLFKNASVADRVIGKAAAMFLVEGGVKYLYTDIISQSAYKLLLDNGIEVEYLQKVERILNRTKDDFCPMEKLSEVSKNLDELILNIENFFKNMN